MWNEARKNINSVLRSLSSQSKIQYAALVRKVGGEGGDMNIEDLHWKATTERIEVFDPSVKSNRSVGESFRKW